MKTLDNFSTIHIYSSWNKHYFPIVHTSIFINLNTFWHLHIKWNKYYLCLISNTKSAAIPDPFIMITGVLFCSALFIWMMVLISPPHTRTAIGTGISVKENLKKWLISIYVPRMKLLNVIELTIPSIITFLLSRYKIIKSW